ncbi:MAG: hypothetical protein EBX70_12890, partial [Betaproteobacteria bacterium]|nr:hypothetical protein [Betaproteobacteria bacterium]
EGWFETGRLPAIKMLLLNKTLPVILSPIGITVLGAASALLLRRPRLVWLALALRPPSAFPAANLHH